MEKVSREAGLHRPFGMDGSKQSLHYPAPWLFFFRELLPDRALKKCICQPLAVVLLSCCFGLASLWDLCLW